MIPFPGESVMIYNADADGVDGTLWTDIRTRAGSRTINDGDEWRAWAYGPDIAYLEAPEPDVLVSWVIEVAAGTATVTVSDGPDPDFTNFTAPVTPLGSFTVNGPQQLVIPSSFTSADLFNGDVGLCVSIVATDGAAVVEQIKLRVWPSGGPLGGWVEFPGFDSAPIYPGNWIGESVGEAYATADNTEDSWDDAAELLVGSAPPLDLTSAGQSWEYDGNDVAHPAIGFADFTGQQTIVDTDPMTVGTSLDSKTLGILLVGVDWRDTYPIAGDVQDEVITPPDEVPGDTGALTQPLEDGVSRWQNAGMSLRVHGKEVPLPFPVFRVTTDDVDLTDSPYTLIVDPTGGTAANTPASETWETSEWVMPDSGRFLAVVLMHSAPAAWPGTGATVFGGPISGVEVMAHFGVGNLDAEFAPMLAYAAMPPYRAWSPTAVVTRVPPLRQRNRGRGRARLRAARQDSPRQRGFL